MTSPQQLYLELLKQTVLGLIHKDPPLYPRRVGKYFSRTYLPKAREWGRDVPSQAHSMIGLRRMNNLQECIERALAEHVPGDLIETGVWRGGAAIFMRGVLKAQGITDRIVWAADSFEGLPAADPEKYPLDTMWQAGRGKYAVDLETVKANFAAYGLLDEQVRFLKGWFHETLPAAPIERLAVLRLDGDLYASTWAALTALYPRLSPGGFVIVDDYIFASCRQAVTDYRLQKGITDPILDIDGLGSYWRKA